MCVIFEYKCGMFAPSAQSVWGSEKKRCPPRPLLICFPPAEAALSCDSTITLKPRRCNCAAVVSKRQRDGELSSHVPRSSPTCPYCL